MARVDAITPLIGTADADVINGGRGSEVISGKGAADVLSGHSGSDHIWGGSAGDLINGNSGNDVLYGGGGPTYVALDQLTIAQDGPISITFEGESAGYRNSLGWYKVDPSTGTISDVDMIWNNASLQGSGGNLIGGVSTESLDVSAGDQIGFFIISNGYSHNQSFFNNWDGSGTLAFVDGNGAAATLNSTNPRLVHTAEDGTQTELRHHQYHSAGYGDQAALNPDGIDHTVGQLLPEAGLLRMGFEDLYNGGDRDFDDAVFRVDLGETNAKVLAGWNLDPDTGALTEPVSNGSGDPVPSEGEDDTIHGGNGDDIVFGRAGADIMTGGNGNDTMHGGSGSDVINGNSGNDDIDGSKGDDVLYGDRGNDDLDGGSGNDLLFGGDGHDIMNGRSDDDQLDGGSGNDVLDGSSGSDILLGGSGNDTLRGGSGDDQLAGGAGNDALDGGSGTDTASYADASKGVNANLKTGTATGDGTDSLKSIENLTGSAFNDKLYGNHRANELDGGDGADRLYGSSGDDVLRGGLQDDYLDGGSGADLLEGGAGNDTLKGYKGADTLTGGAGQDVFVYRHVNEGLDTITDFQAGAGGDVLDLDVMLQRLDADPATALDDFWRLVDDGQGNTQVQVDADGGGDDWSDLVLLTDVELASLTSDNFDLGDAAVA